ncbi:MAG: ATP-binding cassette domain-containing protein [Theionarchaea archaeon]|nr:MAG: ATP-binding protein [Theionarchaea archaeon DG-70]MBU7012087.1 ATP-binding cassette domain-containing protein [Theionarchaea archaeon]
MNMVDVFDLTKVFNSLKAVDSISFTIKKREIFGLLGPNGAGKTTTIRMLTGILTPTTGSAVIGGYDIQKNPLQAKQLMGIVPEMANAYIDLSPLQNLLLMGELYGIKDKREKKARELLLLFGLHEKAHHKVRTLSRGMHQRVIVAMALMNDASILFLDEPTSGLDVESTRLIRDIIRRSKDNGISVLLTTHNISEADQLCDRIAIMNYGRIVAIERPERLKRVVESSTSIEVAFSEKVEKEELLFEDVNKIEQKGDKFRLYTDRPENVIPAVVAYADATQNKVISLNTLGPDLEDVFLRLTAGESNGSRNGNDDENDH